MVDTALVPLLSYPVFMPNPSTYRMHDPASIVPHIRPYPLTRIGLAFRFQNLL
jgi:hypothetical protein